MSKFKKRKGPTPKRKIMIKCENCDHKMTYPHFGDCPKCDFEYAVYA